MELLNQATDDEFTRSQDKLLKYIFKVIKADERLFDIEQTVLQKCSRKVLEKNPNIKESLNTIISGDIEKIDDSYTASEKFFIEYDISKDDYSDKVK